jgi:alanine racemase
MMRTWAEISRRQLAENYRKIQAAVGPGVAIAGVVKADAYGHGAVEVSRVLAGEGAQWLAVSNVAEGIELREAGIRTRILVMGGVFPFEREAIFGAALTPVVHSLDELREWDSLGMFLGVHLKIDSGMARLGLLDSPAEVAAAIGSLKSIRVEGLMTHFASPSEPVQSREQVARFKEVLAIIRPQVIHAASSFALAPGLKESWFMMVRPGIGLYGYAPVCDVKPVLTWKARVVAVKDLQAGSPIGYNARFRAARAMRTAVIAAGYADGLPRALTNRGRVMFGKCAAPIAGAVSMDLTTVDISECPEIFPGAEATIIGEGNTADDIAELTGTISYEILTGIGNRVTRVYV